MGAGFGMPVSCCDVSLDVMFRFVWFGVLFGFVGFALGVCLGRWVCVLVCFVCICLEFDFAWVF